MRTVLRTIAAVGALALGGCMAAGVEVASVGVGSAVDSGFSQARNGAVMRTFTAPLGEVHTATLTALDRMGFEVAEDVETETGRNLVARTERNTIDVEIARLSAKATRLRVLADAPGIFAKDAATGHEIVRHAADNLATTQAAALPYP